MICPLVSDISRNTKSSSGLVSQAVLVVRNVSANVGDVKDVRSTPGSGRSPGGKLGNPL